MRHLSVARGLLSFLASALLCSCATSRGAADELEESSMDHFLDSDAPSLVCDGTRVVGATSFSPTCLPAVGLAQLTVTGLEPLSEPLRACVLTSLPLETGSVPPRACQQGAAQILQGRLRQLGWLDAAVSAQEAPPGTSAAHLHVQLGGRYQVGPVTVEKNEGWKVAPHRILTKARAAAPEGSWYTSNVLADIHSRVFQMRKFRAVWVIGGEPDPTTHVVPVTIDVWEKSSGKPSKPKVSKQGSSRPDHCPKRGSICLNGRDCSYDHRLGCTICYCRPDARW